MPRFRRPIALLGVAILALGGGAWFVAQGSSPGRTHTYYIAAEDSVWDYAPAGSDLMMNHAIDPAHFSVSSLPGVQARSFRKAVYRAYTDSTFRTRAARPAEWAHLGIMGPVLRAEVGDTIKVVFHNRADRPFSMHPHGVFYTKESEGALYEDGTSGAAKLDDAVPPGATHTYVWPVPERAGPGPDDPSSILWPYHSHTHEWRDINAGLIGPMIITRRGLAGADGKPRDIDREFVTLFGVFDEMESSYTPHNLKTYTGDTLRAGAKGPFGFSGNGFQTVNGFMFGNLPVNTMEAVVGERIRWYVFSGTVADDFHSPHWHGGTVLIGGQRADVMSLAVPMLSQTADMVADAPGIWMLHCHVAEHIEAGMTARFHIRERAAAAP